MITRRDHRQSESDLNSLCIQSFYRLDAFKNSSTRSSIGRRRSLANPSVPRIEIQGNGTIEVHFLEGDNLRSENKRIEAGLEHGLIS